MNYLIDFESNEGLWYVYAKPESSKNYNKLRPQEAT